MPLHQAAGREETGDKAQDTIAIADNESIELGSLFTITLHTLEHRYNSFVESESTIMSSDQHYEAGWYLADAFSETMRAARSMVQHREESQKKAVMSAIDRELYPCFAEFADMADICLEAKTDREVHQVLLMIRAQVWMRMCWWNDTKDEGWLFLEECGLSSNNPGQDGGIGIAKCQDARCCNKLDVSCPLLLEVGQLQQVVRADSQG